MRNAVAAVALISLALFGPARAQTTQLLEHLDELGKANEKLQERVNALEHENKELRDRLRQVESAHPAPAAIAPAVPAPAAPSPPAGQPAVTQPSLPARPLPAPAAVPAPAPAPPALAPAPSTATATGTIDLDSEPQGAVAASSLGANCETPCALEISADAPFTVTFTHPGYASATVGVRIQPGKAGVPNATFSPNPVFVRLAPDSKRKPTLSAPQKLGPER